MPRVQGAGGRNHKAHTGVKLHASPPHLAECNGVCCHGRDVNRPCVMCVHSADFAVGTERSAPCPLSWPGASGNGPFRHVGT